MLSLEKFLFDKYFIEIMPKNFYGKLDKVDLCVKVVQEVFLIILSWELC